MNQGFQFQIQAYSELYVSPFLMSIVVHSQEKRAVVNHLRAITHFRVRPISAIVDFGLK
jgi:hypothetical protein